MQFSDTTNKNGIIQRLEFTTHLGDAGISGNSLLLPQFTSFINDYYLRATRVIIMADGRWRWDDSSQTNLPEATTSLVSGTGNYTITKNIPLSGQDWLEINRVECKDPSGTWMVLRHRDIRNLSQSIEQERTVQGTPQYYDFDGNQIYLDAIPNYASSAGLKVWFSRGPLVFATTDTTKQPGFVSLFHEYLVLGPTYEWEKYNMVGNPEQTKRDLNEMETNMGKFYGNRGQYEINKIARGPKSYK